MSTLATAPIGIPPRGLWQRLKGLFKPEVLAVSNADLEATVLVLGTKVSALEELAKPAPAAAPTPLAFAASDVFIAGKRYTVDGVAYTTTVVAGTDRFIAGTRVSADGAQVIV